MPFWAKLGGSHVGARNKSTGWWRSISNLVTGEGGNWFWNLLERKLGNGNDTHFWEGLLWTGSPPLKTRFPRLFNLSTKKDAKVGDMGRWEQGVWIWDLPWRRELRSSEKHMSEELLASLVTCPQSASEVDYWAWKGSCSSGSMVKKLYLELQIRNGRRTSPEYCQKLFKIIWKSTAPSKAQVLGWRIMRNRLPTSDNLRKRVNISGMDSRCSFCGTAVDSCRHLFVECSKIRIIWDDLIAWIGVAWAAPNCTRDHLHCFSYLLGERGVKNLSGLWTCVVWVWWKWRNEILFGKKDWDLRRIIEEIKCRFWVCRSW